MDRKIKIMLVEDEAIIAKYLRMELELEGFEVIDFIPTGEKAVKLVETEKPDVVLMDIKLAGKMDGIQAAKYIIDNHKLPIIFMTSYSKLEITKRAKQLNPAAYFNKPITAEDLKPVILEIIEQKHNRLSQK